MGKSRMMGAGNASAILYKCSPNSATGGGNKKQGVTSRVGLDNWENRKIQTKSNGIGRFKLFFMNQLGGVEPGHSMFGGRYNRGDGLMMNMYERQLQYEIKEDEQNGIFHPIEKRETIVKRRTIVKSGNSTQYGNLTWYSEDANNFIFIVPWNKSVCVFIIEYNGTYYSSVYGETYVTDNIRYVKLSKLPYVEDDDIDSVTVYFSQYYPPSNPMAIGACGTSYVGIFDWTRTTEVSTL